MLLVDSAAHIFDIIVEVGFVTTSDEVDVGVVVDDGVEGVTHEALT